MDIELQLTWRATIEGDSVAIDDLLFALLRDVQAGGHLNFAAKNSSVSYRHAWGLIRTWEKRLGSKLLISRRGQGAILTDFGEQLIRSHAESIRVFEPDLARLASQISTSIAARRENTTLRVRLASSHDDQVVRLRDLLANAGHQVTMEMLGSEGALRKYRRAEADVAGFHLPIGKLAPNVTKRLIQFLDDERDEIYLLEKRVLGFLSRSEKSCRSLSELIERQLRFVNRQAGSATRLTFDGLISSKGHQAANINGYGDEEYTHSAVAALVASKDADVAFGQERTAAHFDLEFEAMVEERFYFVLPRSTADPIRQAVADFCEKVVREGTQSITVGELRPTVVALRRIHQ